MWAVRQDGMSPTPIFGECKKTCDLQAMFVNHQVRFLCLDSCTHIILSFPKHEPSSCPCQNYWIGTCPVGLGFGLLTLVVLVLGSPSGGGTTSALRRLTGETTIAPPSWCAPCLFGARPLILIKPLRLVPKPLLSPAARERCLAAVLTGRAGPQEEDRFQRAMLQQMQSQQAGPAKSSRV